MWENLPKLTKIWCWENENFYGSSDEVAESLDKFNCNTRTWWERWFTLCLVLKKFSFTQNYLHYLYVDWKKHQYDLDIFTRFFHFIMDKKNEILQPTKLNIKNGNFNVSKNNLNCFFAKLFLLRFWVQLNFYRKRKTNLSKLHYGLHK